MFYIRFDSKNTTFINQICHFSYAADVWTVQNNPQHLSSLAATPYNIQNKEREWNKVYTQAWNYSNKTKAYGTKKWIESFKKKRENTDSLNVYKCLNWNRTIKLTVIATENLFFSPLKRIRWIWYVVFTKILIAKRRKYRILQRPERNDV